jgi:homogentisate 1,2-dioxygenase
MFENADLVLSKAHAEKSMDGLYRNGGADEMLFVHSGKGTLHTNFGVLEARAGDYLVIPRGVIWRMEVAETMHLLVAETAGIVETPSKYRNAQGQLLEHSPYCERDIRTPKFREPLAGDGPAEVTVKLGPRLQKYLYETHPFDLVGWDGFYFPWALSIHDFEPVTGRIHQPPPVHQTFQAPGLVVCSFVPRLFDYHPLAIPVPYAHSNVDSEEILFYSAGEFMSRKGIESESISYHPAGLPHGPQPGKIEKSLGAKATNELAVMIDTFKPLRLAAALKAVDDPEYPLSWLEKR